MRILVLSLLFISPVAVSMQPQPARWKGRAILMSRDPQTQQWRVLLSHRPLLVDPNNVWADFDAESPGGQPGNVVAAGAVNAQTNNVFGITPQMLQVGIQGQRPAPNVSGDWFQFIPLGVAGNPPFISGQQLYQTARTALRDDFVWVSANDIINNQPIVHPRMGQPIRISRGVHAALRGLLPGAIQQLNQRIAAGQPVPTPQPVAPQKRPNGPLPAVPQKPAAQSAQVPLQARAPWGPNEPGYIYFYQMVHPYYEFTNFYPTPINLDGVHWSTSEHYFQAQKYPSNPKLQERIRKAISPREAFNITRDPKNDKYKDANWDAKKMNIMLKVVRAKFAQSPDLQRLLLNTDNQVLVEDSGANDAIWGAGADYMGTNHLGRILMHVRDEIRTGQQRPYNP